MTAPRSSAAAFLAPLALAAGLCPAAAAQLGSVDAHQKLSPGTGGFFGVLNDDDEFGFSMGALGDLDGDGVTDLAVGAPWDDDGGADRGAVWILFLNTDGTVKAQQKISDTAGGFTGTLFDADWFGWSVAAIGDLDNDGVTDLGVGALQAEDVGLDTGALWILFLNANGTVKASQEINNLTGGLGQVLFDFAWFGASVAPLGDFDGDGVEDVAVGAFGDSDAGIFRGAVYALYLNADGTVKTHAKINDTTGGFTGDLDDGDEFGWALAAVGDLDGNGSPDLAASAELDDDGGQDRGAVWVLFLQDTGDIVASQQKISDLDGGFSGALDNKDHFGRALAAPGDLDGDGTPDLSVGAHQDDDGGKDFGAAWNLLLNADGTVAAHQKISALEGDFDGALDIEDHFGGALAALGDLDGDGDLDLCAGAPDDDDGGLDTGAAWVLFLEGDTWSDLGFALAGAPGVPVLSGDGSLAPLTAGSLDLSNAAAASPAMLFLSTFNNPSAFKGGLLVPVPPLLQVLFFTDGTGALSLPFTWPFGPPSGTTFYFQYAIQDAGAVKGVALSNALAGTTP